MTLAVDADLISAIVLPLPYSEAARSKMARWRQEGEVIIAPVLWEYEVTSSLRMASIHGLLTSEQVTGALQRIMILNIRSIPPTEDLHVEALAWAERLGQTRAYGAQYLALAEQTEAELRTADERLRNRARQLGVSWVRWVEEE